MWAAKAMRPAGRRIASIVAWDPPECSPYTTGGWRRSRIHYIKASLHGALQNRRNFATVSQNGRHEFPGTKRWPGCARTVSGPGDPEAIRSFYPDRTGAGGDQTLAYGPMADW